MALIRQVLQHPQHGRWAYVEYSDEQKGISKELGSKNFATKEEAEEFSKGFEPFSYVWVEPKEIKLKRLLSQKENHEKQLENINNELKQLQ